MVEYRDFLNLNKYMDSNQKLEKIQKILNMFVNDKEILDAIKQINNKFKEVK